MSSQAFRHNGKDIFVTTPSGAVFLVAEASDSYWADYIVYALELEREMREEM